METIIRVLFSHESDAYKSQQALRHLDDNADVSLGESYIITRPEGGGDAIIKSAKGEGAPEGALGGGLIGGLLGLLGGPIGVLIGGSIGTLAGAATDFVRLDDINDYLDEFAKRVPAGKTLLVAHVWEDDTAPVNAALQPFHGQVSRFDVALELRKASDLEAAQLNREIIESEEEWRGSSDVAQAERKARLDELTTKRAEAHERVEVQTEQQKQRYQGWLDGERAKVNDWQSGTEASRDQRKRERLEKRIASQEAKLNELYAEAQSV